MVSCDGKVTGEWLRVTMATNQWTNSCSLNLEKTPATSNQGNPKRNLQPDNLCRFGQVLNVIPQRWMVAFPWVASHSVGWARNLTLAVPKETSINTTGELRSSTSRVMWYSRGWTWSFVAVHWSLGTQNQPLQAAVASFLSYRTHSSAAGSNQAWRGWR